MATSRLAASARVESGDSRRRFEKCGIEPVHRVHIDPKNQFIEVGHEIVDGANRDADVVGKLARFHAYKAIGLDPAFRRADQSIELTLPPGLHFSNHARILIETEQRSIIFLNCVQRSVIDQQMREARAAIDQSKRALALAIAQDEMEVSVLRARSLILPILRSESKRL